LEVGVGYVVLPGLGEGDSAHFTELFVVPVAELVQKAFGQAPCFTAVEEDWKDATEVKVALDLV
jgi:hypothetical protein